MKAIWEKIFGYYRPGRAKPFLDAFERSPYGGLLQLPLLVERATPGNIQVLPPEGLSHLSLEHLTFLEISNAGNKPATLEISHRIPTGLSLEEGFRVFNLLTHNVITLGDFRNRPQRWASSLSGAGYFVFHGDGYCSSLAFMLQAFLEVFCGKKIDLGYCRTQDGFYTHAYGQSGEYLVDPALKTFCRKSDLERHPPVGWLYTLIKRAGTLTFENLPLQVTAWLFSADQKANLEFMNAGNDQAVYRPEAEFKEIHEVFLDTFFHHSVEMSLERDDFAWKKIFRDTMKALDPNASTHFFSKVDQPVQMELPAGSSFELGGEQRPAIVAALEDIYYGRKMARLKIKLAAGDQLKLQLPEAPLLMQAPEQVRIFLNDAAAEFHPGLGDAASAGCGFIGGKKLEEFYRDGSWSSAIRASEKCEISLYIPFNALFVNSAYSKFSLTARGGGVQVSVGNSE